MRQVPNDAQQGIVDDRQHKPCSKRGTWPAPESKAELMDDPLDAPGTARSLGCRRP